MYILKYKQACPTNPLQSPPKGEKVKQNSSYIGWPNDSLKEKKKNVNCEDI